ncbi:hypothetical protein [Amycolatopsis sp. CA-230715]|uniref:hypothetical protein n=1 Tax=Amycolatopsis sp. CA-230715 TaxID=2745196 RepID=UPI001C010549|nr:hypothetical protein [Amycolatopsis sp. CA-230715]
MLRVLALNNEANAYLEVKLGKGKRPFTHRPGSNDRSAWQTLSPRSPLARYLPEMAERTHTASCKQLAAVLVDLCHAYGYVDLDERRGMDFHRHRPQSLDSGSPRSGPWKEDKDAGWRSFDLHLATPDPDYDEQLVATVAADGLEAVAAALNAAHLLLIGSVQDLGYKVLGFS